jgi:hypothetical protein
MAGLTRKAAMWLQLIFGGIFAVFGLTAFLSAVGSGGLPQTLRLIVAGCFLMLGALYLRKAWSGYRDGRNPKQ